MIMERSIPKEELPWRLAKFNENDRICNQCMYDRICTLLEVECKHIVEELEYEDLEVLKKNKDAFKKNYWMPVFELFEITEDSETQSMRTLDGIPKPPPHEERMKELALLGWDEDICEVCPVEEHCSYLKWLCKEVRKRGRKKT